MKNEKVIEMKNYELFTKNGTQYVVQQSNYIEKDWGLFQIRYGQGNLLISDHDTKSEAVAGIWE